MQNSHQVPFLLHLFSLPSIFIFFFLLLHHFLSWKFLHHSQSLCCYYSVFCGCCGGCSMSSLFCVVVMSHVVGPFLQCSIHVVVQRFCSRFWGCCYNVFHGCYIASSCSFPFFSFPCSSSKILLKFSWLLLFMVSRLPWEPLYIIIVCVAIRSLVVIIFSLFFSHNCSKIFLLIFKKKITSCL